MCIYLRPEVDIIDASETDLMSPTKLKRVCVALKVGGQVLRHKEALYGEHAALYPNCLILEVAYENVWSHCLDALIYASVPSDVCEMLLLACIKWLSLVSAKASLSRTRRVLQSVQKLIKRGGSFLKGENIISDLLAVLRHVTFPDGAHVAPGEAQIEVFKVVYMLARTCLTANTSAFIIDAIVGICGAPLFDVSSPAHTPSPAATLSPVRARSIRRRMQSSRKICHDCN